MKISAVISLCIAVSFAGVTYSAEDPAASRIGRSDFPAKEYAKLLNNTNEKARQRGMRRMLGRHANHPDVPQLLIDAVNTAMHGHTETEATYWMIRVLGQVDQPEVVDTLLGWLHETTRGADSGEIVFQLIEALGSTRQPKVQDALIELLDADDPRVIIMATDVLGHQPCDRALEPIMALVGHRQYQASYAFRFSVLNAVGQFRGVRPVGFLIAQLPSLGGQLKLLVVRHLAHATAQRFGGNTNRWVQWWQKNRHLFREVQRQPSRPGPPEKVAWDYPVPTFYDEPVYGTRVVFVIDMSSTMKRATRSGIMRLEQAKAQLTKAIAGLPGNAVFNVIAFDADVHAWQPASVMATAWNKRQAIQVVQLLRPGAGTAIFDGLSAAFEVDPNTEAIYLLTDGLPTAGRVTDEREILRIVTRENRFRKISINTIAVGRRSDLLLRLSKYNFGSYRRSG